MPDRQYRPAWGLRALIATASLLALAQGAHAEAAAAAAASDAAGDPVSEVVVTAPRQEVKARVVQLQAPNLISVQSAETIAKYPDFNAAESLGRMPGISLSTDTGEGRFINIRGIDGNLDGATFGGVPLLNTNPGGTYFSGGGRAVEFDTIPDGAIDGLIVTYTGLPDHEAEGLGGSVDLTPRTAANITKPFIEGEAGTGYEPAHGHDGPTSFDLAVGARFGFDNGHLVADGMGETPAPRAGFFSNPTPFSFVLTGSTRADRRGFDDIEEDYNNPGTSDRSYQDIQFRRYDYHRVRVGYGGEFDFTPNEDHTYYLRANVAGYTESVKKNRLTFDFSNYTQTPDGSGFDSPADVSVKSTDERETHRNQIFVVGGRDEFGAALLDYRASYSTATYDQQRNYGTTFTGPSNVLVYYNNSGNNGDFPQVKVLDGTNVNNASLYNLKKGTVSNGQEHDRDEEYAYAANLLFPVHLINDSDRIKVGFEVRLRTKTQNVYSESLKIGALNLADASSAAITDFYDHGYSNGPNVNTDAVTALARAIEGPDVFDPSGYFKAREYIYAGYAQYAATVGKFGLLAGVRVESTHASYGNYVFDGDGNQTGFSNNPKNYTNVFPTVQLRYDFTPKLVLRATYSTGIARPGFNQVAGAVTVDTSNGIITTGNPNLKPTTGNNFDLDLEYYLPEGGIVQIGAFDKEFTNYVVTRVSYGTDPRLPDVSVVKFQTFANVASAYARGIEAAYHQKFAGLPKPLDGLGIESNVTLVDSRIQEYDAATSSTGHAEYGLLPGTSRVTANLAGFYEAYGIEARLSGQYVSAELFSLGGSKATDTIQDNRLTLDFASSYKINGNWTVYFNAKNLTNAPLRFYMGNSSFPIQREFYDVTYEAGVKARF
ncbi:MAG: TonB-dependent receptor [Caulobacteraceae bacterium]|nr:TonB-dependent receptor [Caulobacteraceae bacterium]